VLQFSGAGKHSHAVDMQASFAARGWEVLRRNGAVVVMPDEWRSSPFALQP
jgi:hypothetical protein